MAEETLPIREMVARSGVSEATLRMWERRYGFPSPTRLPGGHRRYTERDVELVRAVVAEREAGASLPEAIERARRWKGRPEVSLFAALRRRHPELEPRTLPKRLLTSLSHTIEDETTARAGRGLLLGAFQRVGFYRRSERRWRELSRTAELALVFADFDRVRRPRGAPIEVPVDRSHPLSREWALLCEAPGYAACISAWEPPTTERHADGRRPFEVLFTLEPGVLRDAAGVLLGMAERVTAAADAAKRLRERPSPAARDQLELSTAITGRVLERVGRSE
jgi:DNA-binding transcriptional MerR regulator